METQELELLKEKRAKATQGEWKARGYCFDLAGPDGQLLDMLFGCVHWEGVGQEQALANADLIVSAVNALPKLLELIQRQQETIRVYEDEIRD